MTKLVNINDSKEIDVPAGAVEAYINSGKYEVASETKLSKAATAIAGTSKKVSDSPKESDKA